MSAFLRTLRVAALAALVPLAAACSDDDASGPRQPQLGSYRMTLAGDHAATHSGAAIFGVDGEGEDQYFGVVLGVDEDDLANLIFLRSGTARLAVGTHQVANTFDSEPDDAEDVEVLLGIGNTTSSTVGFLDGQSGTITVTRSTADELAGTFSITARGLIERNGGTAQPATVQISGAFNAEGVADPSSARMRLSRVRVQRLGN